MLFRDGLVVVRTKD